MKAAEKIKYALPIIAIPEAYNCFLMDEARALSNHTVGYGVDGKDCSTHLAFALPLLQQLRPHIAPQNALGNGRNLFKVNALHQVIHTIWLEST